MFNNGSNGYSLSDIAAATGGLSNRNNDGGFGGDGGAWWIIILFLFCFMGWGGNGFGGRNNDGGVAGTPGFQGYATRADIESGFATNNILSGINAIQSGICDSTYALSNGMNTGFNGITNSLTSGFSGVDNALCQGFNSTNTAVLQGFNGVNTAMLQGQNALATQLANCCCENREAIAGLNYNMAQQSCDTRNTIQNTTRDIIDNANNNSRAILDFLTQSKIDSLQSELSAAHSQLSQLSQTNNIISSLRTPAPIPAYTVANPYSAYMNCCSPCSC